MFPPPNSLPSRQRLAERLRELRGRSTGKAFAAALGWGEGAQSKVSKIERGAQSPSRKDLHDWAAASGANLPDLLALQEKANAEFAAVAELNDAAGGADARQKLVGAQEAAAERLVTVEPAIIPALVQTADYAEAVMQPPPEIGATIPLAELARAIAARLARSAILHEPGRDITLLIGEAALWNVFTGLDVHLHQLAHLATQITRVTHATIGVLPFQRRTPFPVVGPYTMLDDVVINETFGGDLDVTSPGLVAEYQALTKLLVASAVTGPAAVQLVLAVRDRIQAQADGDWWASSSADTSAFRGTLTTRSAEH